METAYDRRVTLVTRILHKHLSLTTIRYYEFAVDILAALDSEPPKLR